MYKANILAKTLLNIGQIIKRAWLQMVLTQWGMQKEGDKNEKKNEKKGGPKRNKVRKIGKRITHGLNRNRARKEAKKSKRKGGMDTPPTVSLTQSVPSPRSKPF